MPHSHYIELLLDLEDTGIVIHTDETPQWMTIKGRQCNVLNATLSPTVHICQSCGMMNGCIIRHGTKLSLIQINSVVDFDTYLRLHKQRYLCQYCGSTFIATTALVAKHCSIVKPVKISILLLAKQAISEKTIAEIVGGSHQTVHLIIQSCYIHFQQTYTYLPIF